MDSFISAQVGDLMLIDVTCCVLWHAERFVLMCVLRTVARSAAGLLEAYMQSCFKTLCQLLSFRIILVAHSLEFI